MQRVAVEGDHETLAENTMVAIYRGLFPDSLFKARVATFDNGFEVFVHSGLHEFGLGGGGGLNGAGQGGGFMFRKSLPLSAFRDGQGVCPVALPYDR
jgi:hypothetical protein